MVCEDVSAGRMSGPSASAARPRVSIVIPNYNGSAWLPGCLGALAGQQYENHEVLVVDNGSTDGSVSLLGSRYPHVQLIELDRNFGFAGAVNRGIRAARGEYVALLNNDTVARPDWLATLVRALDDSPDVVAAVGSNMLSLDDPSRIDDAGDALSWTGAAEKLGHGDLASGIAHRREVFSVCAGAALFRRSFLETLRGFDERFFAYLEDVDLGLRGRLLGYRYVVEPAAEVLHKGYGTALPRADYVRLVTRNRLMLFAKSLPVTLALKHLPQLLYGQLYFAIVYRHPAATLAGYAAFLRCLPHLWRERRRTMASCRIAAVDLERMLTTRMHEPPLRDLALRRLRRWRSG